MKEFIILIQKYYAIMESLSLFPAPCAQPATYDIIKRLRIFMPFYATPTPAYLGTNPAVIDLHRMGRLAFFAFLAIVLFALLLKIILDFRRLHYKD